MVTVTKIESSNRKVVFTVLIIILVIGAFLRFYHLDKESLWLDELHSWRQSSYNNLVSVINKPKGDIHPPGYRIFLYFIQKYAGDSIFILRFPSAVSGVFSIAVIFLLGCYLYSYREGLIAAALMAVLWCPIFYSQEARAYSLLLLFTMLSTFVWLLMLQRLRNYSRPSYYLIIGYIISAIILSYLHYFGLYVVFLQGIIAFLFSLRSFKKIVYVFLIWLIVLLAYIPWLPAMMQHMSMETIWYRKPTIYCFFDYLKYIFNDSPPLLYLVLGLYAVFFTRELDGIIQKKSGMIKELFNSSTIFLAGWLVIPFLGVYIRSIVSTNILTFRNLIILLPAAYLLLARSITRLPFQRSTQTVVCCVIAAAFMFNLIITKDYYFKPYKPQWKEGVKYIADQAQAYDDYLVIGWAWREAFFNYYFKKFNSPVRVRTIAGREEDIPRVSRILEKKNPAYLFYISADRDYEECFRAFLCDRLNLIAKKEYKLVNVWLFDNKDEVVMDVDKTVREGVLFHPDYNILHPKSYNEEGRFWLEIESFKEKYEKVYLKINVYVLGRNNYVKIYLFDDMILYVKGEDHDIKEAAYIDVTEMIRREGKIVLRGELFSDIDTSIELFDSRIEKISLNYE